MGGPETRSQLQIRASPCLRVIPDNTCEARHRASASLNHRQFASLALEEPLRAASAQRPWSTTEIQQHRRGQRQEQRKLPSIRTKPRPARRRRAFRRTIGGSDSDEPTIAGVDWAKEGATRLGPVNTTPRCASARQAQEPDPGSARGWRRRETAPHAPRSGPDGRIIRGRTAPARSERCQVPAARFTKDRGRPSTRRVCSRPGSQEARRDVLRAHGRTSRRAAAAGPRACRLPWHRPRRARRTARSAKSYRHCNL